MGKIVPLPNQHTRHFELGAQALAAGNYPSAVAHLDKAFKQTPVFEVAQPLVNALVSAHQAEDALPYLSEFMEDFLGTSADVSLLYDALLAIPDFRFAWAVLHHVPVAAQPPLATRIQKAEAVARANEGAQLAEVARQVRHLGGLTPHAQEQLVQTIGQLPKPEMIEAVRPNLTDPDVHPAIRVSLLDALTAVGDDDPTAVLGFETEGTVVPADLTGVWNDPTQLAVLDAIQRAIGLDDPELMRATVETLRFELGYLYPFTAQAIPDPTHFAHSYLAKSAGTVTPGERAVFDWLTAQTAKLADMA